MNVHDFAAAFAVGDTDFDFTVKTTWSSQGWVKSVPAVGCADDHDIVAALHTVHQGQHLSDHTAFHFTRDVFPLGTNGVYLVDEDDGGRIIGRFIKDFWKLAYALNSDDGRNYVCWDEQDGFYYDVLYRLDGSADYLRTRSLAGLIPLLAVASFDRETVQQFPMLDIQPLLKQRAIDRGEPFPELDYLGEWHQDRILYSLVPKSRLVGILRRVFDEQEFLSPYGIRGLSKHYEENPYTYREGDEEGTINYSPADSPVPMFGGNSNWRGPVWLPINYLIIEALQKYAHYFGDDLKMEFPTGSGHWLNLWEISLRLEERLINLFRRNQADARPFNGSISYFDDDPHWRDLIRFNEYFHGDDGRGLGASHQTGWTAIVSKMITQLNRYS